MREYSKKPESQSRTLDSNPKASRQAPIDVILQRYQKRNMRRYASAEEEKPLQRKFETIQRIEPEEEESIQGKFATAQLESELDEEPLQRKANNTGLSDNLKNGIENLSGYNMDDVKVHYNSKKPAQLNALAYTQGTDIHIAPEQEKYLSHEAWHVVQQKQGRVQPTLQMQGININDNEGLEREADLMGAAASGFADRKSGKRGTLLKTVQKVVQRTWAKTENPNVLKWDATINGLEIFHYLLTNLLYIRIVNVNDIPGGLKTLYEAYQKCWLTQAQYDYVKEQTTTGVHIVLGEIQAEEKYNDLQNLRLEYNTAPSLKKLDLIVRKIYELISITNILTEPGLYASLQTELTNVLTKRDLMIEKSVTDGDDNYGGNKEKIKIAQKAIEYSKHKITHGPQNQHWARQEHGDEGDVNMSAMIRLVDFSKFKMGTEQGNYNLHWTRPRRIGAAVEATGGGNCQDIAALTYNYLREHGDPSWSICFVVNNSAKHSFATIGDPTLDQPDQVVVADAWVKFPRAVTLSEHFCKDGCFTVLKKKRGGKLGRTTGLMSKYWILDQLPTYVKTLKQEIRLLPRSNASWNNNFPEGK